MGAIGAASSERARFDKLNAAYLAWLETTQREWLAKNNTVSPYALYELMTNEQRKRVDYVIADWKRYIAPLNEDWWRRRGYRVVWPDKDEDNMKLVKIA